MKYLLWLCAVLGALGTQAQSRHVIDLSAQTLENPLKSGRIAEVLDARPDRTSIGWVQVGLTNERVPADLKKGVVPALLQLAQPPAGTTEPITFTLRVLQLSVGELTTGTSETGNAEVVVDFLRPRPDGQYDLLWRAAESTESRGMEVTGKHAANIAAALRGCLQQFEAAGPATLSAVAVLTAERATVPPPHLLPLTPYPLQTETVRRPGVYHSLEEFRRNAPSGQKVVALTKLPRSSAEWAGTSEVELFYVDGRGGRTVVRNVWGYCDGQDLYILYQRHYYLLTPNGEGFSFEAPSAPTTGAVTTGAVLGGMVGAGIAAAASGGRRQEHRLSMLTGRITPMPLHGVSSDAFADDPAQQEGQIVVYRRKPSPNVVDVYAGKRVAGGLNAETGSVTVVWADRRNALKLCLRAGEAPDVCVDALPRPGETLYYEWVEGPAPVLKPVSAREGAFEARKAELRAHQQKD